MQLSRVLITVGAVCAAASCCGVKAAGNDDTSAATRASDKITLKKLPLRAQFGKSQHRDFVDQYGRQRIFHGSNVVVKGDPWLPRRDGFDSRTSLSPLDFKMMEAMGLNSLRLGFMWPGAEPQRGVYNEGYFTEYKSIVDEAKEYGIHTYADMHQDALSEHFCGEGVPDWAVDTAHHNSNFISRKVYSYLDQAPRPLGAKIAGGSGNMKAWQTRGVDGFPTRDMCKTVGFQHGYGIAAAGAAWDNLYLNYSGLTERWGLLFAKLAKMMKGENHFLGMELINEPFAGNPYKDPLVLLPRVAHKYRLQPAYDLVASKIREEDDDALIIFAGVTWGDMHGRVTDNWLQVPGGEKYADRSVFSVHHYSPIQQKEQPAADYYKKYAEKNAERMQSGVMVSEFDRMAQAADYADFENAGASYNWWEWKPFCRENVPENWQFQRGDFGNCGNGVGGVFEHGVQSNAQDPVMGSSEPEPTLVYHKKLVRMYPRAVQGVLTSSVFNEDALSLKFTFAVDLAVNAPTEVFIGSVNGLVATAEGREADWDPKVEIEVTPKGALTIVKQTKTSLEILGNKDAIASGTEVQVVITHGADEVEKLRKYMQAWSAKHWVEDVDKWSDKAKVEKLEATASAAAREKARVRSARLDFLSKRVEKPQLLESSILKGLIRTQSADDMDQAIQENMENARMYAPTDDTEDEGPHQAVFV